MSENTSKNIVRNKFVRALTVVFLAVLIVLISKSNTYASSTTKVHIISLRESANAILLESNGHFGMVDSGEDNFFPPNPRPGVIIGMGVEEEVKSYLRSIGVNSSNFDFYIGTHAHSDHIGSADQIIREFKPKVVYVPIYKDKYIISGHDSATQDKMEHDIKDAGDLDKYDKTLKKTVKSEPRGLWDNQFVYNRMVKAAKEVGAKLYIKFNSDIDHFDFGNAKIQLFNTDQSYIRTGVPNANEMSLGVRITSENGVNAFIGGDMTNIAGIEAREKDKIGKVSLMTTNHHGYWGSNSYDFINTLDPEVMVSPNKRVYLSTNADPNDNSHTSFNTITDRIQNGMKIYSTGALHGKIPAAVFELDETLTNNIPSPLYDAVIGYGYNCNTRHRTLKDGQIIDGVESGIDGSWVKINGITRFKFMDGEYAFSQAINIDGTTYNFNENGDLFSGWAPMDGYWVYFGDDGRRVKGWLERGSKYYYLDDNYHMVTGVKTINGVTYHFEPNGKMTVGWGKTGNEWYYCEKSGKLVKNQWKKLGGKWYYLDGSGVMATGVANISGTRYCFNEKGHLMYGWYRDKDNTWYYGRSDGYGVELGWKKLKNIWYYFDNQGKMVTGKSAIKGKQYFFLNSGAMKTGWANDNGTWYYGEPNGSLVKNSWKKLKGKWYYFDNDYRMVTGKRSVRGKQYFFLNSGDMKTGWAYDNGTWYYGEPNGSLINNSWKKLKDKWYYFDNDYRMVTGKRTIGDKQYFFLESGDMKTGWAYDNGTWYYGESDGSLLKSTWKKINGDWFYFEDNSEMATGKKVIGGKTYILASSGKMMTGWRRVDNDDWQYYAGSGEQLVSRWRKIDNKWYYFDEEGLMVKGIVTVKDKDYFFYESGAMKTGWIKDGEKWHFAGEDGSFVSSQWEFVNNEWYYFDEEGNMVSGKVHIDDRDYEFDEEGRWIKGSQKSDDMDSSIKDGEVTDDKAANSNATDAKVEEAEANELPMVEH